MTSLRSLARRGAGEQDPCPRVARAEGPPATTVASRSCGGPASEEGACSLPPGDPASGMDFGSWTARDGRTLADPGSSAERADRAVGTKPAQSWRGRSSGSPEEGSMRRLMGALSVRAKLSLAPAVLGTLVLALWGALYGMASVTKGNDERIAAEMEKSRALGDAMGLAQAVKAAASNVLETWDPAAEGPRYQAAKAAFDEHDRKVVAVLGADPDLQKGYDAVKADVREMVQKAADGLTSAAEKASAEHSGASVLAKVASERTAELLAQMDQSFARVSKGLRDLEVAQRGKVSQILAATALLNRRLVTLSFLLLAVAM